MRNTTNGALLVCMDAPIGTTMKPKESDGYIGEDPGSICVKMRVYYEIIYSYRNISFHDDYDYDP